MSFARPSSFLTKSQDGDIPFMTPELRKFYDQCSPGEQAGIREGLQEAKKNIDTIKTYVVELQKKIRSVTEQMVREAFNRLTPKYDGVTAVGPAPYIREISIDPLFVIAEEDGVLVQLPFEITGKGKILFHFDEAVEVSQEWVEQRAAERQRTVNDGPEDGAQQREEFNFPDDSDAGGREASETSHEDGQKPNGPRINGRRYSSRTKRPRIM